MLLIAAPFALLMLVFWRIKRRISHQIESEAYQVEAEADQAEQSEQNVNIASTDNPSGA